MTQNDSFERIQLCPRSHLLSCRWGSNTPMPLFYVIQFEWDNNIQGDKKFTSVHFTLLSVVAQAALGAAAIGRPFDKVCALHVYSCASHTRIKCNLFGNNHDAKKQIIDNCVYLEKIIVPRRDLRANYWHYFASNMFFTLLIPLLPHLTWWFVSFKDDTCTAIRSQALMSLTLGMRLTLVCTNNYWTFILHHKHTASNQRCKTIRDFELGCFLCMDVEDRQHSRTASSRDLRKLSRSGFAALVLCSNCL